MEPYPTAIPPLPRSHRLAASAVAIAALLGVAAGALGDYAFIHVVSPIAVATAPARTTTVSQGTGSVAAPTAPASAVDAAAIAARVDPAIVDPNTVISAASGAGQGAATGLILTSGGEVLTNHHVVAGATSISVTIAGRTGAYSASVVGVDAAADVALIQVRGVSGLPTVSLGTATVDEAVVALGNALGKGGAPDVTQGTITALDQSLAATDDTGNVEQLAGMLETDASIVPGDSGGALVDAAGNVVGMITAGSAQGSRYRSTGSGYAVPAATALGIVNRIRAGQAGTDIMLGQPGYIGVTVAELDPTVASQVGVSGGVSVTGTQAGSPAARAGIPAGAVITSVGQLPVGSISELGTAIHQHHPGEALAVTWVDSQGSHTARLTLVSGPAV